jgi:hypothetical protein
MAGEPYNALSVQGLGGCIEFAGPVWVLGLIDYVRVASTVMELDV